MDKVSEANKPIGVFDSGIGGISVLDCLKRQLPTESFVYLGDMARVPYGTKSKHTVVRYAIELAQILLKKNIKLLVVACNTATALALPELRQAIGIPVIGVIEHSAVKACQMTKKGHIALIATEGTVASRSYETAIHHISPTMKVSAKSCGLLVSLAEEGFLDHPITELAVREYLSPFFAVEEAQQPDCLILGCTHYPFLLKVIKRVLNGRMVIVNSAEETAVEVEAWLHKNHVYRTKNLGRGRTEYLVTDAKARFLRLAQLFLGEPIAEDTVTVFDL